MKMKEKKKKKRIIGIEKRKDGRKGEIKIKKRKITHKKLSKCGATFEKSKVKEEELHGWMDGKSVRRKTLSQNFMKVENCEVKL